MEENLAEIMQNQRQENIEKFKRMSSKYISRKKINLWNKYVDNYYDNTDSNEHPMTEVFNYVAQLTDNSKPENVADLFMRRTGPFNHAKTAAKTIAFFSIKGEEFYKDLTILAKENNKEDIIDEDFAFKLGEINVCDDIDEGLLLLKVKNAKISIGDYEDIKALCFENGFIKGLTKNSLPVIGEKFDNLYVFYIIHKASSYERFLIHDPKTTHLNKKKQTNWGFITNNKGEFLSTIKVEPIIEETDEQLTLSVFHERDDIYQYLTDNHIILPIIREIYELGLPINEESKTLTINAIMFREMQESLKLQKEPNNN